MLSLPHFVVVRCVSSEEGPTTPWIQIALKVKPVSRDGLGAQGLQVGQANSITPQVLLIDVTATWPNQHEPELAWPLASASTAPSDPRRPGSHH